MSKIEKKKLTKPTKAAKATKPSKPEKSRVEKSKPEKAKVEKSKTDKARAEKTKPEKGKVDKARPEKGKAEKAKPEKAKPEKAKVEKAKVEKAKPEKSKVEKPKAEPKSEPKEAKKAPPARENKGSAKPAKGAEKARPEEAKPSIEPEKSKKKKIKGAEPEIAPEPPAKPAKGSSKSKSVPPPDAKASKNAEPGKKEKGSKNKTPSEPKKPSPELARDRIPSVLAPTPAIPQKSIEERVVEAETRLAQQSDEFRKQYGDVLDMSWIFHDGALEGTSYSPEELRLAIDTTSAPPPDSSLQQVIDEVRRHRAAIAFIRDYATKRRQPVTVDTIKQIYWILHPEEPDFRSVKFRKDIPQHRLYFHEYTAPDKIQGRVRQIVDWLNDKETWKGRSPIRVASRAHYDLLRVFPFSDDSGKVSRLLMNLVLLRSGYPPAIIHHTERQRYYESLKGSPQALVQLVTESIDYAVGSVEKFLDERESKKRSFVQ